MPASKTQKKQTKSTSAPFLDPKWSILLFGIGALFVLLAFIQGESGWAFVRENIWFGVFGISGWLIGPFLIFLAVLVGFEKPIRGWIVRGVVFALVLCGTALVFGGQNFDHLSFGQTLAALHDSGAENIFGGGLLSLFFGWSLLSLLGETAARALMILFFILALMLFFKITPAHAVHAIVGVFRRVPRRTKREKPTRKAPEQEAEEELCEEEDFAPPVRSGGKRKGTNATAMPALMPPAKRQSRHVDIDLGPDAQKSEEGLCAHDEVSVGPGGTFGLNPLQTTPNLNEEDLPFDLFAQANHAKSETPPEDILLFGKDDPYHKLGGIDTKLSPENLPDVEYIGPDDAPEFDLFRSNPEVAEAPLVEEVAQAQSTVSEISIQPDIDTTILEEELPAEALPQGDASGVLHDPSVEAMIDRAALEKASAKRVETPFAARDTTGNYVYPSMELFTVTPVEVGGDVREEMTKTADLLVSTLSSFGVQTRILDVSRGPSVTRYEIQPQAGVKISKITGLSDDIALNLATAGVRIEAPIPGKPAVGIEVPNNIKSTVSVRSILESEAFRHADTPLPIALGMDIAGESVVADLTKMPHLLIAGSTGSGKSVCVNATIMSFLYRSSPEDLRLLLIDPKVVELAEYNGIPHLLMPVVTEPRKAAGALGSAVAEMERRYHLFAENNVRDIRTFNKLVQKTGELEKLPYIAIVIDELADLMMTAGKQVEDYICRIAQKARAAGMHLIVATQRPSVDVITGLIKANIPSRVAFSVSSQVDSRTILDAAGADKLLGMGDMLFLPVGASKPVRVQGTYVKDKEISAVLQFIKDSSETSYDEGMIKEMERRSEPETSASDDNGDGDDMMHDPVFINAVEVALETGQISTSFLQRRLRLGYARAGRMMDEMERLHIVSPPEGSKPRQVLIDRQQWLEMSLNNSD